MVQVVEVDTYRPYFEFVPCWDYFPDLGAPTFAQMDCEFQRHVYSRAQLKALQAREDFDRDAIEKALARMPNGNYQKYNYDTDMQAIGRTLRGITHQEPPAGAVDAMAAWISRQ